MAKQAYGQTYGDWIRSNPPRPTKKYKKEHMAQQSAVTLFEVFFYKNAKSVGINNNKWQIDETTLDIMLEKAKAIEKEHDQFRSCIVNNFPAVVRYSNTISDALISIYASRINL